MICNNCESEFDDPRVLAEPAGEYFGTPGYVHIEVCPICGSDDIEESARCPICGTNMLKSEDCCHECVEWIRCTVGEFISDVESACNLDYDAALEYITQEIERRNI